MLSAEPTGRPQPGSGARRIRIFAAARAALGLLCLATTMSPALGWIPRDIVFQCPCSADWTPDDADGDEGELTLTFGIRSYRERDSSVLSVFPTVYYYAAIAPLPDDAQIVGTLSGNEIQHGLTRTIKLRRPEAGAAIDVTLAETIMPAPHSGGAAQRWKHESLSLWPVPGESAQIHFVDILTDSDGDGVADVNERIAGTSPDDPESLPGGSVVDVLTVYNDGALDQWLSAYGSQDGFAQRIHHLMAVANAIYMDSGTNIRLRTVGMSPVEIDEYGVIVEGEEERLQELHGSDVTVQFHGGPNFRCGGAGGCAGVGSRRDRGHWRPTTAFVWISTYAWTIAHELGHVMGLLHSARQGEDGGAFRWSRGHTYGHEHQFRTIGYSGLVGTIMAWGAPNPRSTMGNAFSDPTRDCFYGPCGSPAAEPDGADAVATLDLIRFQVAAHRASKDDADGDGFVDPADAAPDDPTDWIDRDGDGLADNADTDDDNDGVEDSEDTFPLDPDEWEDLDGDGVGDNADGEVDDLAPFRDPALRAVVESALGRSPGATITADDMATLTALESRDRGIRDLTGLELATGLDELRLAEEDIQDLSPLSGLTELKRLYLPYNAIIDLSPLTDLKQLTHVDLIGNEIRDISPLSGLANLNRLELELNEISDVGPLSELRRLDWLNLRFNRISNLTGLSELAQLTYLELSNNDISDIAALSSLTALGALGLHGNAISDLTPLSPLARLQNLSLSDNQISDLTPLSELTRLGDVFLNDNDVSDLTPLSESSLLINLWLHRNRISDISPLSELRQVRYLGLESNAVSDLAPLSQMTQLRWLLLSDNDISDLKPLSGLRSLQNLQIDRNRVRDLTPLADLERLERLNVGWNRVSLADVLELPYFGRLEHVGLAGLGIRDLSPLGVLGPVSMLDLRDNDLGDIGPLLDRSIWNGTSLLYLQGNALGETSILEHIATLRSWGVRVGHDYQIFNEPSPSPPARIRDPALRAAVVEALGGLLLREPVTRWRLSKLGILHVSHAGISDMTGLESAERLRDLFLGSNYISELGPLENLPMLHRVDLSDNLVSDIGPLVANKDFSDRDWVALTGNPLSEESLNDHIPELLERGARVVVASVRLIAPSNRETTFDTSGYFAARLGSNVVVTAEASGADLASVDVSNGVLAVTPGPDEGTMTVTLTATDGADDTATLVFDIVVAHAEPIPMFPSASDMSRQGFARVINHSSEAGTVRVDAVDDGGGGPERSITLAMNPGTAAHFNSDDLESGNRAKRLTGSAGRGEGDWRLDLASGLDIEVLSYIRTPDGFLTSMHDVAPEDDGVHRVAILNPGSNIDQVSLLRVINPGGEDATVTISGVDGTGASPGGDVEVSVPAGAARTFDSADLEAGIGVSGELGDGEGKWELTVSSDQPIRVMSLLESPSGHLTNLSTIPVAAEGTFAVPLFPPASDSLGRQGFVRVINRGETAAEVDIAAFDETDRGYDPLTLTVGANETVHFNSDDVEDGNVDKGLSGSTGAGQGDWRLEVTSEADIEVLSYIRTTDGFLTSMHDIVPGAENRHRVAIFNPGSNTNQVSRLRMINAGDVTAQVTITGIDDEGQSSTDDVRTSIPAGTALSFTAAELESGAADLAGALGTGAGKWQLFVQSDQPTTVMSLLESPTGHLTNLSTAPGRDEAAGGAEDASPRD